MCLCMKDNKCDDHQVTQDIKPNDIKCRIVTAAGLSTPSHGTAPPLLGNALSIPLLMTA